MATKINPGAFDAYRAALPDEPYFLLLARDQTAPKKVRAWADEQRQHLVSAKLDRPAIDEDEAWNARYAEDMAKARDADLIAHDMEAWRAENEGVWRKPTGRTPLGPISPALKDFVAEITIERLCSFLVVGTNQVVLLKHDVRNWSMPGFNCRTHRLVFDTASDAFHRLERGAELTLTDWHVSGFEVALGDMDWHMSGAHLHIVLQTVGE